MGEALQQRGWHPDAVWCSTAVRAAQTWRLMAAHLQGEVLLHLEETLYLAGLAAVRACAGQWRDDHGCVAVVGHNPGWEDLVASLTGKPVHLTTGNVVRLEGQGATWVLALQQPWALGALLRPRPPRGTGSIEPTNPSLGPVGPTSD